MTDLPPFRKNNTGNGVAEKLREMGFVPLPRLWVKREDMPLIHDIAHQYFDTVNRVRSECDRSYYDPGQPKADPVVDKEAAWAAFERERSNF